MTPQHYRYASFTKDMKASLTNWMILKLLALFTTSCLILLAAFSMIVQMDTEMNALELNASTPEWPPPQY
jgi:hypothetical protein